MHKKMILSISFCALLLVSSIFYFSNKNEQYIKTTIDRVNLPEDFSLENYEVKVEPSSGHSSSYIDGDGNLVTTIPKGDGGIIVRLIKKKNR